MVMNLLDLVLQALSSTLIFTVNAGSRWYSVEGHLLCRHPLLWALLCTLPFLIHSRNLIRMHLSEDGLIMWPTNTI